MHRYGILFSRKRSEYLRNCPKWLQPVFQIINRFSLLSFKMLYMLKLRFPNVVLLLIWIQFFSLLCASERWVSLVMISSCISYSLFTGSNCWVVIFMCRYSVGTTRYKLTNLQTHKRFTQKKAKMKKLTPSAWKWRDWIIFFRISQDATICCHFFSIIFSPVRARTISTPITNQLLCNSLSLLLCPSADQTWFLQT